MKRLIDKLKEKKKGMTTIEAVIGTLIFIMCFVALMDILILSNRYSVLNNTAKELARTVSVQGGALAEKPASYSSNYYNIEQLANNVRRNMEAAGFQNGDWTVTIECDREFDTSTNSTVIYADSTNFGIIGFTAESKDAAFAYAPTPRLDYMSRFNVTISAKYEWKVLPAFIGDRKSIMQVTMPGLSEWKYNYDKWESEG